MAQTRRQLRSGTVLLGGMGLLAAALTACSSEPDKRCVDRDSYDLTKGYKVVSDKDCKTSTSGSAKTPGRKKSLKKQADAAWYYEGKEKDGWVEGGSFTKPGEGGSGSGSYDEDDGHHSGTGGVHRGGFGGGKGSSGG
ncbi:MULTISPECIES: hypothetical protein [Streptomyces]|uniref:Lipoprotein n=1 Tax=Streptomyces bangladeshensis TaxID=295352 RepID=A0ABN3C640_9ACTN|nr:hypothetical protein [Streptomyces sp. EAS-AB2608]MCE0447464.1 hypothetical protein [Streptomyces tricolor]BCM68990.1 putative secreted protein [Streptomyces sp. EAS-AB2608]